MDKHVEGLKLQAHYNSLLTERDALAESHAELVAATDTLLLLTRRLAKGDWRVFTPQERRDIPDRAQAALAKARALVPAED